MSYSDLPYHMSVIHDTAMTFDIPGPRVDRSDSEFRWGVTQQLSIAPGGHHDYLRSANVLHAGHIERRRGIDAGAASARPRKRPRCLHDRADSFSADADWPGTRCRQNTR